MDGQREHESEGSEDEQDEGDYSVYECPGLAPVGFVYIFILFNHWKFGENEFVIRAAMRCIIF